MLPCRSNDSIIFYSLGDPYKYSDIMNIYKEINYFNGKDNRFHTIISKREFNNGSDYFMHEDIENKARMEFEKITGFSEKNEFVVDSTRCRNACKTSPSNHAPVVCVVNLVEKDKSL